MLKTLPTINNNYVPSNQFWPMTNLSKVFLGIIRNALLFLGNALGMCAACPRLHILLGKCTWVVPCMRIGENTYTRKSWVLWVQIGIISRACSISYIIYIQLQNVRELKGWSRTMTQGNRLKVGQSLTLDQQHIGVIGHISPEKENWSAELQSSSCNDKWIAK